MSSASAERTFSVMRRIKTYLRTTMSSNSLNNCMFTNIHKEMIDELNAEKLAEKFIDKNDERRRFFGSY